MVISEEKCFLSGVVEGFYGRPWTCTQRRELFSRMRKSTMNTYIYAPKDDTKHRALWRQLYTKDEECKLKVLIEASRNEDVTFVYAISPGLDISFANNTDVSALKKKMKQVAKLGCRAFALLFDDINPTLKPSDAVVFKSSAQAQTSLTNELYTYLKKPRFLFCPTEYCKTRAIPNVKNSEYLLTLGEELFSEIDIMWTGDKVIPEVITKESIQELGVVLKRKPVIWDNIHANDYDQRRVFLGAYCGRPIELYPFLNGILTNPNCEFEANYIAIHTLGTWYRIASSAYNQLDETFDVQMEDLSDDDNSPISNDDCNIPIDLLPPLTAADVTSVVSEYDPKNALKLAINDWLDEFYMNKKAPLKSYSKRNLKTMVINGQTVLSAAPYDLDMSNTTEDTIATMIEDKVRHMVLTDENLMLLTELFCLPYGHGDKGDRLLQEFKWLITSVGDIYEQPPSKEKVSRWFDRLLRCDEHCQDVYKLFENFCKIPNEAILYDLYPYIWDLKEVVLTLDTFVHWLSDSMTTRQSIDTFSVNELPVDLSLPPISVMNDFIEPWHINYLGGLTVALHKLLPFSGGYMFLDQAPDVPSNNVMKIRTYSQSDKEALYNFCAMENKTEELIDNEKRDLYGDRDIGRFAALCPETLFLIEDKTGVCGYVATVPNNKHFIDELHSTWLPAMKEKYTDEEMNLNMNFTDIESWRLPTSSHLAFKLNSRVHDECIMRRILGSALSVLKASGSTTIYHHLENGHEFNFYTKLGFFPVSDVQEGLLWRAL